MRDAVGIFPRANHLEGKCRDFQGANVSIPKLSKEREKTCQKIIYPGSATIEFEESETHNQINFILFVTQKSTSSNILNMLKFAHNAL